MAPKLEFAAKSSELPIASPTGHPRRQPKSTKFLRILKLLVLLSVAATLSTVLPTPWSFIGSGSNYTQAPLKVTVANPADEWKDNIWPFREQAPWDISTDFPHPRKLEFDVTEGTWLRLDVHPKSGDVVFDMLGDIYCLPASEVTKGGQVNARAVLAGVPHDVDPHFSPEGDRLVFRSDAEHGIENIWVTEWKGCENMDVRSPHNGDALKQALEAKEEEEQLLNDGKKETVERKANRLLREGRFGALRVTNETYRWVSDARFHSSGTKVIATKWYTSERSLGAGEGWEYDVPSLEDIRASKQTPISAGSGRRIVARTLPRGWSAEEYGDQQIGPEQIIWNGDDLIYSKNVQDASAYEYSKDVHKGIYSIFKWNTTTNSAETLVSFFPGGASRPELSRDRQTLAFVRRVRDKQALVLKDLKTGSLHNVWYGLTYDVSSSSAPMGTYPSFAFTPSDDAIIIWAAGQIYTVPLTTNSDGERVAASAAPSHIPFKAHIETHIADTLHHEFDVLEKETKEETQRVHAFKDLRIDDKGKRAVFQAAGQTYLQTIDKKTSTKVLVAHESAAYYSPTFVHGAGHLVLHARWSNTRFSSFEIADLSSGIAHELTGIPLGRYFSPILCECSGDRRQIAFVKSGADELTGDVLATGNTGLWIGELTLPAKGAKESQKIQVKNARFVKTEIDPGDGKLKMRFFEANKKLLVQQADRAFIIDLGAGPDENGEYKHTNVALGKMSAEMATTLEGGSEAGNVAFVDFHQVYLAPGSKAIAEGEEVWSKPGNATAGLARVSLDGGHSLTFTRDGKKLFWFLGPYLHSLEVSQLKKCESEIKADTRNFGIACVKKLLEFQEVIVEHPTEIARLKKDAGGNELVIVYNATLLTMESGKESSDLIPNGILVTQGGVIRYAGAKRPDIDAMLTDPAATLINAQRGYVVPGYIDVHAHWNGFSDRYPAASWELETFLAYGVTTLHNPSADNVDGQVERSRVENGGIIGPRIFTVGDVIYGAGAVGIHQDIADDDEARSALVRIKVEGGPAGISYKNYNLPSRASRQRLLLQARKLKMMCVPEGGMNLEWDLTYIMDGMTTVEHALPIPVLFDDIITLFALSGTGNTPTHVVNYGGAFGEQYVWATEDLANDHKLRKFHRHDTLQGLSESTARPLNSYQLFNTSASVAKMVQKGLHAHIGAHGEPPLGLNYHAEMSFTQRGGLSNYETLRAATSSAAETLGLSSSIGSLSRGKLADYIVYPGGVNLLDGDLSSVTRDPRFVVRGGRIWDASTMEEIWPLKGRKQTLPPFNAD